MGCGAAPTANSKELRTTIHSPCYPELSTLIPTNQTRQSRHSLHSILLTSIVRGGRSQCPTEILTLILIMGAPTSTPAITLAQATGKTNTQTTTLDTIRIPNHRILRTRAATARIRSQATLMNRRILLNEDRPTGHSMTSRRPYTTGRRVISLVLDSLTCHRRKGKGTRQLLHLQVSPNWSLCCRTASALRQYRYDHQGALWTKVSLCCNWLCRTCFKVFIGRTRTLHWTILLLHSDDSALLDCEHCIGLGLGALLSLVPKLFPNTLRSGLDHLGLLLATLDQFHKVVVRCASYPLQIPPLLD